MSWSPEKVLTYFEIELSRLKKYLSYIKEATMISKNQISELADNISKKFNLKKIIVFGSYAYGKPDINSDLDLCIITDLGNKRKIDLLRDIRREITLSVQLPIDILVYGDEEFTERSTHQNTLEYKIAKQGLLING